MSIYVDEERNAQALAALAEAEEIAPFCRTLAEVGRTVNAHTGRKWTAGRWRGLWKTFPDWKPKIQALLGTGNQSNEWVTLAGDRRGIVINDVHAPYHDRRAVNLFLKVLAWYQPDDLFDNGDSHDCYSMSRYNKDPNRANTLQEEIDIWQDEVAGPIDEVMDGDKYWFPGNHENRVISNQNDYPQFSGLRALELPNLFSLRYFGYRYASSGAKIRHSDGTLIITHGTVARKWAGYSAKGECENRRYRVSTVTGHVHRAGRFVTSYDGQPVYAHENPCLCDLNPEYMDNADWQQGFTVFEVHNGILDINTIDIHHGRDGKYHCRVKGKWFSE